MTTITKEQLSVLVNTANVIHINRNLVKRTNIDYSTHIVTEFIWEGEEGELFSQPVNAELFEYYPSIGQVRWVDPEGVSILVSFYVTSPLTIEFKS